MAEPLAKTWKDIAIGFLRVGVTAYGGPGIMGVMQAEFQGVASGRPSRTSSKGWRW